MIALVVFTSVCILVSRRARVLVVVFGGIFVFQSSSDISGWKIGYIFLVLLATLVSAHSILRRTTGTDRVPLLFISSALVLVMIAASLPMSILQEVTLAGWLRSVLPYILVAVSPILALDATAFSQRQLAAVIVFSGAWATVAFSLSWMQRRGLIDTAVFAGMASFMLPAALFSFAVGSATSRRALTSRWSAAALGVFVLMFLTGTRTSLTLLAGPTALFAGKGSPSRTAAIRVSLVLAAMGLLFALLLVQIHFVQSDEFLGRIATFSSFVSDPATDQSFQQRIAGGSLAWEAFLAAPLFGVGPGHIYSFSNPSEYYLDGTTLDSPLIVLSKFGLVGVIILLCSAILFSIWLRQVLAELNCPATSAIWKSFVAITALHSLLASPTEDKGFGFTLALLVALTVRRLRDRSVESRTHASLGHKERPVTALRDVPKEHGNWRNVLKAM